MIIEATRQRQIILVEQRELNLNFYKEFSKLYTELKAAELSSKEIRNLMTSFMRCSGTSFYSYLREARSLGLVTDTYAENRNFGKNAHVKKAAILNTETISGDAALIQDAYNEISETFAESLDAEIAVYKISDIPDDIETVDSSSYTHTLADMAFEKSPTTPVSDPDSNVNPFDSTDDLNIITTSEGIQIANGDWNVRDEDADVHFKESKPKVNDYPINRFLDKLFAIFSFKKK